MWIIPSSAVGREGETYTLLGRVQDRGGRPVSGAMVSLNVPPFTVAVTDETGAFTLELSVPFPPGELMVVHPDYPPQKFVLPPDRREVTLQLGLPVPPAVPEKDQNPPVLIEAEKLFYDQERDAYRAQGKVVVIREGNLLMADEVELNRKLGDLKATGNVTLKRPEGDVAHGDKMHMDISQKTGVLEQGQIFIKDTHFYIRGDRLAKTGEATYNGDHVQATTCDGDNPDWWVTGRDLNVTVDGAGSVRDACFYVKKIPLFYTPYFLFPAKTTRQTGFLLPHRFAFSENRLGVDMGVPFFWAIGEDKDATFYQRFMSKRGFQEGVEFRYAAEKSHGTFYAEYLRDKNEEHETIGDLTRHWQGGRDRWAVYVNQETTFGEDVYLRADIARVSDSYYFKDFTSYNYFLANYREKHPRPFQQIDFYGNESLSYLESSIRMAKSWQNYQLSLLAKNTQDLTTDTDKGTLQKYPEVAITGVKRTIGGTPVWFDFTGMYDYFYRSEGQKGHLIDISPNLSLPLNVGYGLRLTPMAGVRGLVWSRDDGSSPGGDKTDHREVYNLGASLTTELSRTFDLNPQKGDQLTHTINPEVMYLYSPATTRRTVPDYVPAAPYANTFTTAFANMENYHDPTRGPSPTVGGDYHVIYYSLTNVFTRKWDDQGKTSYQNLGRIKLAQYYDIREAQRDKVQGEERHPFSDVFLELDTNLLSFVTLSARNRYDVYGNGWREQNYDVYIYDKRGDTATLTYRNTKGSVKELNTILKAVVSKSLDLRFNLRRDFLNEREVEKGVGVDYRKQCWGVSFDFGDSRGDTYFSFRFSLLGM